MSTGKLFTAASASSSVYPEGSLENSLSKLRKGSDARVSIVQELAIGEQIAKTILADVDGNRANVRDALYKLRTLAPTKLEVAVGDPREIEERQNAPMLRTATRRSGVSVVFESYIPVTEADRNERKIIQSDPFERILMLTSLMKILLKGIHGNEAGYSKYQASRDGLIDSMRDKIKLHDELVTIWKQIRGGDTSKSHTVIDTEMRAKLQGDVKLLPLWEEEFRRQNGAPELRNKSYDDFTYELEETIESLVQERNQSRNSVNESVQDSE